MCTFLRELYRDGTLPTRDGPERIYIYKIIILYRGTQHRSQQRRRRRWWEDNPPSTKAHDADAIWFFESKLRVCQ